MVNAAIETLPALVKVDLGCGPNKKEGFTGIDRLKFDGVDLVLNIGEDRWPFDDGAVDEAFSSHFVEHLKPINRVYFCNELYRVLKPGGFCTLIVPHWSASRAYGDPTHEWPPIGEFWFLYLNREWREANAPHTDAKWWEQGFNCHFEVTYSYSLPQNVATRNQEFQHFAMQHYREAIVDIHATMTKPKPK